MTPKEREIATLSQESIWLIHLDFGSHWTLQIRQLVISSCNPDTKCNLENISFARQHHLLRNAQNLFLQSEMSAFAAAGSPHHAFSRQIWHRARPAQPSEVGKTKM